MLLFENISMAYSAIKSNKMRSFLTMLGIIIGIGSVIAIKTVGSSLTKSVSDMMEGIGASNITIGVTQKSTETTTNAMGFEFRGPKNRKMATENDYITDEMLDGLIEEYGDDISYFNISKSLGKGTITIGGNTANVSVEGGNEGYYTSMDLDLLAGSAFGDKALDGAKSVCIVSDNVVEKFYDSDNEKALGQTIEVIIGQKFYDFTIVGVYKYSGNGLLFGGDEDPETTVYVPLRTIEAKTHVMGYAQLTAIKSPDTLRSSDDIMRDIETYFDRYYHINKTFEVTTSSMESLMEETTKLMGTLSTAISIIAGISLVVGGIGVMNIMLVSISERTREIGTRKALGATNKSIRIQFIVEAMMLCLFGGAIGIIVGVAGGSIAAEKLGYAAAPDVGSIALSVIFSLAIGVFFGYYPANKAAQMNPIDALRYE